MNQSACIQKLKADNKRLTAKVNADHEDVISLHREMNGITIREQEIDGLKSVVGRGGSS